MQELELIICESANALFSYSLFYNDVHYLFPFRVLVYEYVNNGNLEQWLHGAMRQWGFLTWEARMKIIFGTAKASVSCYLSSYYSSHYVMRR